MKLDQPAQVQDENIRTLVKGYPVPMWLYTAGKEKILAVNDGALQRWGYSREEFLALSPTDLRPLEEWQRVRTGWAGLGERAGLGFVDEGLWKYKTKEGKEFYAHVTTYAVEYAGAPAEIVMALDEAAELVAKDIVREHESLFVQLHDSLSDALWAGSADGTEILYLSPGIAQICGYSANELKTDPMLWEKCVVNEDRERFKEAASDLPSHRAIDLEYRIRRKDGQIRWIHDRRKPIFDRSGAILRVGGVLQDVTAAHDANAQLAAQNESLERNVAERTAQLAASNDAMRAFSYMAAHDLKAPLRAISGFTDMVLNDVRDHIGPESVEMLERVQKSAVSMGNLIDDLLTLAEVSVAKLQRKPLDLTGLSRAILNDLKESEPHRRIRTVVQDGLWADADGGLTISLLGNLIRNAWKFTGKCESATIEIGARASTLHGTVFYVKDNGVGFLMADAALLFQPFKRLHSTSQFAGTGIGLAICQRIVSRHGGDICAESEPGVGTTLHFTLLPGRSTARLSPSDHAIQPA
jgi:PAS domain S-box-containing protein